VEADIGCPGMGEFEIERIGKLETKLESFGSCQWGEVDDYPLG